MMNDSTMTKTFQLDRPNCSLRRASSGTSRSSLRGRPHPFRRTLRARQALSLRPARCTNGLAEKLLSRTCRTLTDNHGTIFCSHHLSDERHIFLLEVPAILAVGSNIAEVTRPCTSGALVLVASKWRRRRHRHSCGLPADQGWKRTLVAREPHLLVM